MGPSVGWNSLLIELFGLNCAQMAPERAESDFCCRVRIDIFGAETDLNFQCIFGQI